ncbi:hypothetical protein L6452_24828 [Arctium lappa]|uniref:Uncharacterized protein n=1 Tax=Arctium lappa TaxID=4217 RepID=A0ACB9A9N2_ARCLA|nr:hypothetical protein L6452_24828 [Arctium lappa]
MELVDGVSQWEERGSTKFSSVDGSDWSEKEIYGEEDGEGVSGKWDGVAGGSMKEGLCRRKGWGVADDVMGMGTEVVIVYTLFLAHPTD